MDYFGLTCRTAERAIKKKKSTVTRIFRLFYDPVAFNAGAAETFGEATYFSFQTEVTSHF